MALLPPTIHQGILNFPGATPESKATAERLLEQDREKHHCFWGKIGLHNHLSHHILAAYDLGVAAQQLEAIYNAEKEGLDDIHLADRKTKVVEEQHLNISPKNWTEFLGQEKFYASYVRFFSGVIAELGRAETLEQYIFSPSANGNGSSMLLRFVGGAVHPLIQTGYAIEFGSDAMLAQALAQTAVHSPSTPEIFDLQPQPNHHSSTKKLNGHRQPSQGHSLLAILRETYDSSIMQPVLPYDPDALLSKRLNDALEDGRRAREIVRLSNLWVVDHSDIESKIEELIWTATLLLVSSGKQNRKPRLDFFLMHFLNASIFLPSLVSTLPRAESKTTLLRTMIPVMLLYLLIRGRPRIDADLVMGYTSIPRPPTTPTPQPAKSTLGEPGQEAYLNPWPEILQSVVHAPDAHTVKAIRALYYGARMYGTTQKGGAIGAFLPNGEETVKGMANVDGTVFVRAAGMVMNTLGWVSHGQGEGSWDRSALGWEDAWKDED
ncbi:hypothetical protein BC835DRAFT_229768 [Cytidiella melzeri]|nr:hypothetical protein BC835DRAFT_229768 [Cytidiella melzeri]